MAFARDTETDSVVNLDRLMACLKNADGDGFRMFFDNGRMLEVTNEDGQSLARALMNEITHSVESSAD